MFKVKGASVYPSEVETALRGVDGVSQAYVTSVAGADGGNAVGAVVVSELSVDQLAAAVKTRVSSFKVPTRWYLTTDMDEVPRTATGKVTKAALRDLLAKDQGTPG
jgi:acyl-CoA synthetase (AMP-forming)/AMP-acid ligase II